MSARRPVQGKAAAQLTKGSVGGSSAAGSTRPSAKSTTANAAPGSVPKLGQSAPKAKPAVGSAPGGLLKRSAAPVGTSRISRNAVTASTPPDVKPKTKPPIPPLKPSTRVQGPKPGSGPHSNGPSEGDSLVNAAQVHSWLFMACTLEDARANTEKSVLEALERRAQELTAEEESVADARIRFETEQLLELYELLSHKQSTSLRSVTEAFLRHETACMSMSGKAMKLSTTKRYDLTSLRTCNSLLDAIDKLLVEACQIESDLLELPAVFVQEESKTYSVVRGMLSIVKSRKNTLSEASQLVQAEKTIAHLQLELASLEQVE
ncbi:hypothetical protein EIP91_005361 [Steccherinum ochraceum]|uniref:Uncharacterized protein n=1 Tax=Steccherinum ochraceum TaxID=92696 RepID=A0A4R0RFM5_9APHY|nr:hypothetical protein EIP91_005361 [Steccherinum ochraceum]